MRTSEQTSRLRNFQEWVDQTTDARLTSAAMSIDAEVQFFALGNVAISAARLASNNGLKLHEPDHSDVGSQVSGLVSYIERHAAEAGCSIDDIVRWTIAKADSLR